MSKKKSKKDPNFRPRPKPTSQIPISMVRNAAPLGVSPDLQHARDYPIYGCWIMAGWQETGLAPVVVARQQAPGRVMYGVYMVDLYCLGVKDAFTRTGASERTFERQLPELCAMTPESCSVELAHEVVYGALEYAQRLGFEPHPDFKAQMADQLLDPPDAHPRVNHVTFGLNGRPLFVAGPNDTPTRINVVLATLDRTVGKGNYDFMTGLGGV
jgi:hypothetical protein